jgi:hypothetical protein
MAMSMLRICVQVRVCIACLMHVRVYAACPCPCCISMLVLDVLYILMVYVPVPILHVYAAKKQAACLCCLLVPLKRHFFKIVAYKNYTTYCKSQMMHAERIHQLIFVCSAGIRPRVTTFEFECLLNIETKAENFFGYEALYLSGRLWPGDVTVLELGEVFTSKEIFSKLIQIRISTLL